MVNVIKQLNAALRESIVGYARFWGVKRFTSHHTAECLMVRSGDFQ